MTSTFGKGFRGWSFLHCWWSNEYYETCTFYRMLQLASKHEDQNKILPDILLSCAFDVNKIASQRHTQHFPLFYLGFIFISGFRHSLTLLGAQAQALDQMWSFQESDYNAAGGDDVDPRAGARPSQPVVAQLGLRLSGWESAVLIYRQYSLFVSGDVVIKRNCQVCTMKHLFG